MKDDVTRCVLLVFCVTLVFSCARKDPTETYTPPPGISWSSVLRDSIDLNNLVVAPNPVEKSLHFSSSATTGKVLLAYLAPEILGDMDHGFFLRVEEHESGVDATLAEAKGAGMFTWIWSANPIGTVRLFVDNEKTPAYEGSFQNLLQGSFLPIGYPFAALTVNGHNLHFPIIHTNFCRLVVRVKKKEELATLFYQVAWNSLNPTEQISAFSPADISKGASSLRQIAESLKRTMIIGNNIPAKETNITRIATHVIFASSAPGVVTNIIFKARSKADLAALEFSAFWDDSAEPSIRCPLNMLVDVSERMEDTRSLPSTVKGGRVEIRWPMPYREARIEIRNCSANDIPIHYSIQTDSPREGMRFHATYSVHKKLRTENKNILGLADMQGRGRIVGCNIVVKSRTSLWWGEGDPLIYLDSVSEPTWRGTGAEDYFGFAWCSTETFQHPFRGQSSVVRSKTERTSAMHRYHFLDQLPFHHFASFQTEAWGLAEGDMDYESLVLYYSE